MGTQLVQSKLISGGQDVALGIRGETSLTCWFERNAVVTFICLKPERDGVRAGDGGKVRLSLSEHNGAYLTCANPKRDLTSCGNSV